MGAMGNAIAEYTRPLLDTTDGSPNQVQWAMMIGQLCWNLALTPPGERDKTLEAMRKPLKMDDASFEEFRRDIVGPMLLRHEDMFPQLHQRTSSRTASTPAYPPTLRTPTAGTKGRPGAGRNEPCPCKSGRKHKHCCGR